MGAAVGLTLPVRWKYWWQVPHICPLGVAWVKWQRMPQLKHLGLLLTLELRSEMCRRLYILI